MSRNNGYVLAGGKISVLAKAQTMFANFLGSKSNDIWLLLFLIVSSFNTDNGFEQSIPMKASAVPHTNKAYRGSDRTAFCSRWFLEIDFDILWILVEKLIGLSTPPPASFVNAPVVDDSTVRISLPDSQSRIWLLTVFVFTHFGSRGPPLLLLLLLYFCLFGLLRF